MVEIVPIDVGDIVKLKKQHPCGANEWEIEKLGMDIGLKCLGCGRRVRVLRSQFNRRFRGYISRASEESS